MRIALISDLHLKHWEARTRLLNDKLPYQLVADSVAEQKPDILIDAGDLELPDRLFDALSNILPPERILTINGNHEYYGGKIDDDPLSVCKYVVIDGIRFTLAPLWMNFKNFDPFVTMIVTRALNDFRLIKGLSSQVCYDIHTKHLEFIKSHPADVIVTHHAPSALSIHPRFMSDSPERAAINYGFISHLDDVVFETGAKFWFHGHVHDPFDYMIGKTRVITNPCGYPHERRHAKAYAPVYLDI